MNMKSKKKTRCIDLKALEKKRNILTVMQNDFYQIVDKEKEFYNRTIAFVQDKERTALIEKENIETVLDELINCCKKKKKILEDYVKVANGIIRKNKELIEKEKQEIASLILKKDSYIELIQKKIDYAKNEHNKLNIAVVNLLNSLTTFLNYKTQGKFSIKELVNAHQMNIEDNKESYSKHDIEISNSGKTNEKELTTQVYEETKMKINESIDVYKQTLHNITLLIKENTDSKNELLNFDEEKHKNNLSNNHLENKSSFLANTENAENAENAENERDEKRENDETVEVSVDRVLEDVSFVTKNDMFGGKPEQLANLTNIKTMEGRATTQEKTICNKDADEGIEKTEEGSDEETEDESDEREEESDEEEEKDSDEEEEKDSDEEEEKDSDEEEEEDSDEEEEEDSDEEEEEDSDEKGKVSDEEREKTSDEEEEKISDEEEEKTSDETEERTSEEEEEKTSDEENESEKESTIMIKSDIINTQLHQQSNKNKNKKEDEKNISEKKIPHLENNERLLTGETEMFLQKIKNLDYDYLSYFEQKLKNS